MTELELSDKNKEAMRVWNNCDNHPSRLSYVGTAMCLACGWPNKSEEEDSNESNNT